MAITITILDLKLNRNPQTGQTDSRTAFTVIGDGSSYYSLPVGAIPLVSDAQAYLDTRADSLWAVAQRKGTPDPLLTVWVADRAGAAGNALENRTLAEALAYIDNASTVAALKLVLKEIVKELYLIRRLVEAYIRNH